MRKRRSFIGYTLVLLIIAGLAYIGYTIYFNPELLGMLGFQTNTSQTTQGTNGNNSTNGTSSNNGMNTTGGNSSNGMSSMPGMSGGSMGNANEGSGSMVADPFQIGQLSMKNKEKLSGFITLLTDAVNQITLDPYSSITTQGNIPSNKNTNQQGSVSIYPNGTSTINVGPGTTTNNVASGQTGTTASTHAVMSQSRLQQLHEGIFKLSQGMTAASDLNDDLTKQAIIIEASPPGYQTYLSRYNLLVQNRMKLGNALSLLSSASTLVNVNPYGQYDGYGYDPEGMKALHGGIYKLAQAMGLADSLSNDLLVQISNASYTLSNFNSMSNMNMKMNTVNPFSFLFDLSKLSTLLTWVVILLAVLFGIGLIGTLGSLMSPKKKQP